MVQRGWYVYSEIWQIPQSYSALGKFKQDISKIHTLSDSVTTLDGRDKKQFLEFAGKMLQWLPEDRKTASELLNDPWFRQ
jgi:hypothetical protein